MLLTPLSEKRVVLAHMYLACISLLTTTTVVIWGKDIVIRASVVSHRCKDEE